MSRISTLVWCALLLTSAHAAQPPLPMAVVRAHAPDALERLVHSPLARLLPTLPLESQALPGALAQADARDVWCIIPAAEGVGSVPRPIVTWTQREGADASAIARLLPTAVQKPLQQTPAAGGRVRITLGAPEGQTRLLPSALDEFLAANPDGLGAWVALRQPFAALTALTGTDMRRILPDIGLAVPESGTLELTPGPDGIAAELTLHGAAAYIRQPAGQGHTVSCGQPWLGGVRVAVPHTDRLPALGENENILFAANMDARALVPASLCIEADWSGEQRWRMAGVLRARPDFDKHYKRMIAWLQTACNAAEQDGTVWFVYGGREVWLRADTAQEPALLLAAGSRADLPDAAMVREALDTVRDDALVTWTTRTDHGAVLAQGADLVCTVANGSVLGQIAGLEQE